jgi:hypothetical protein
MKKLTVILSIISLMSVTASSAFATDAGTVFTATGVPITGTKTGGTAQSLGTLSSKVVISVFWSDISFAAATRHTSGSKSFASSSTDSKIYSTDSTELTALTAVDSTDFSGWTAM